MAEMPPRPSGQSRAAWAAYWRASGQPWRTEPEVDLERQRFLDGRRRTPLLTAEAPPFPFATVPLSRADVEWLLLSPYVGAPWSSESTETTQAPPAGDQDQDQTGPHDYAYMPDGHLAYVRPLGLDLRGADVRGADLSGLPLGGLWGGTWLEEGDADTIESAAIHLEGANLHGADLNGAVLGHARLEGANLTVANLTHAILEGAHLEHARLGGAQLLQAYLAGASLLEADLTRASLLEADLRWARLDRAHLADADLRGADLWRASLRGASGQYNR